MVQVLLWLTASLPSHTNSTRVVTEQQQEDEANLCFEILLHAIFALNLLGIGLATGPKVNSTRTRNDSAMRMELPNNHQGNTTARMCCVLRPSAAYQGGGSWNHGTQQATARTNCNSCYIQSMMTSVLEKLAPSLWVALNWVFVDGMQSRHHHEGIQFYLSIAGITLVTATLLSWFIPQYYRGIDGRQQHHVIQPSATIHRQEQQPSDWEEWTTSQVAAWLSETLLLVNQMEDANFLLAQLAWHGIDGAALERLNTDALVRHMDIPYGMASRVMEHIETRLTKRYPRRSTRRQQPQPAFSSGEQWVHQALGQHETTRRVDVEKPSYSIMADEEMQQVRDTMMQRFGFQLPELPHKTDKAQPFASVGNSSHAEPPTTDTADEPDAATTLEQSLLASMPPHIKDIIRQKPHLLEQVQKVQANENLSQQPTTTTQDAKPSAQATAQTKRKPIASNEPMQTTGPTPDSESIPDQVLQQLPPQIRAVALRNPTLFNQMFQATQQNDQLRFGGQQQANRTLPTTLEEGEEMEMEPRDVYDRDNEQAPLLTTGTSRPEPGLWQSNRGLVQRSSAPRNER
ncbi:expressed unknown protein [Seminavis robusta]|uniref:SAM domain-containing protein n=1 Tax=Seminavis robusta TaxID=568900 RepID=A0A9N8EZV1_9STRA|nr:expressed unknown protein [Seminavis robusta]|eukprot:Sro2274_g321560.1 n/a (572) ;mRNA; r:6210-7925